MEKLNRTVDAIPGYARDFIQIVHEKCNQDLDFSDSSISKLDEIALSWQSLSKEERFDIFEGMCFYLGEVIRKNMGGCWIDPKWKNPNNLEAHCYLHKVGGLLKVTPSKLVEKRLLEGGNESFLTYYRQIKQKAKSIKKDLAKERSSNSRSSRTIVIDRYTSVITLYQFLAVFLGWILCRKTGYSSAFLAEYGYALFLIPMIWALLMIYENTTNRIPGWIVKPLGAFGFVAIFLILGLFLLPLFVSIGQDSLGGF